MNLSEKGWFKKLIGSQAADLAPIKDDRNKYLYRATHSNGLLYGHPVLPREFKTPEFLELPENEKFKLILLDGFIKTAIFPDEEIIPQDPDAFVHFLAESIIAYYSQVQPHKKIKERNFWGKKLSNEEIVEELLNDRLNNETEASDDFWVRFFNNSLLFLDVFFFGEWLPNRDSETSVQKIREQRDRTHLLLLEVVAAAAYADKIVQDEERVLFDQLLTSAQLPPDLEETAARYIEQGADIDNLDLSIASTWLLRKYLLELAILTIWADKVVYDDERQFIKKLAGKLGFSDEELENSMLAIESFVVSNWGNIPFLQDKHSFKDISERYVERLSKTLEKNSEQLSRLISENKELQHLLEKMAGEDLNDEEQIQLRTQLLQALKELPTFVVISLPGSFLTLPLLLNILPENILPANSNES